MPEVPFKISDLPKVLRTVFPGTKPISIENLVAPVEGSRGAVVVVKSKETRVPDGQAIIQVDIHTITSQGSGTFHGLLGFGAGQVDEFLQILEAGCKATGHELRVEERP